MLFSLAPLAIVLVFAFGLVLRNEALREDVTENVIGWLPLTEEGGTSVADAINQLASPTSGLGLIPLAMFLWAASGMMGALRTGLEAALAVDRRRQAARGKLVDLALVGGVGVLVIVVLAVSLVTQVLTTHLGGLADATGFGNASSDRLLAAAGPLGVTVPAVALVYRFVPSRRLGTLATVVGAATASVLLVAISFASVLLLESASSLSAIYGSITVVLVFLYAVYLHASVLLYGAAVAAAFEKPDPDDGVDSIRTWIARARSIRRT